MINPRVGWVFGCSRGLLRVHRGSVRDDLRGRVQRGRSMIECSLRRMFFRASELIGKGCRREHVGRVQPGALSVCSSLPLKLHQAKEVTAIRSSKVAVVLL